MLLQLGWLVVGGCRHLGKNTQGQLGSSFQVGSLRHPKIILISRQLRAKEPVNANFKASKSSTASTHDGTPENAVICRRGNYM